MPVSVCFSEYVCVNLYESVLFVVFPRLCLSEIESTLSFALYFFPLQMCSATTNLHTAGP